MTLNSGLDIGVSTEKVRGIILVLYLDQSRVIRAISGINLSLGFVCQVIV